ncbi:helix-turn-helix transcriptional regulator [Quatrionicoccus australiensis]|uniref:helix-turn-helix transcriptional regulator n=1 Tax=Quatrionicoccus australiensis TaxID=138118 RepID=UPI001CF83654|nr:YafY family protein [Quatrionicoccus australiensis]UCV14752.1 YafY family transcriptional regulator [Quatrionicoccus australiensis]
MTKSERFGIIERMLLSRRSVSFAELQQRLEVSRATLHRDIKDLRERMNVPILCDRDTGTYRIDNSVERYELPGVWFSAGEIHALLSMQQLLAAFDAGGLLAEHVGPLRQRLLGMLESTTDSAADIARRIRILSAAARHYAPQHFQHIAAALMERRRLSIDYVARSKGDASQREISPQRLTHYRDNWYLDAWCHLRDELRSFAVDAIKTVKTMDAIAQEISEAELDAALGAGYGIFAGAEVQWATLLFTPDRARWVAAEHWHPEQEGSFLDDGSYQLRLPYSNDPELIMDILKYGPDCEVVGPAGLREKVVGLLKAAVGRYGDE